MELSFRCRLRPQLLLTVRKHESIMAPETREPLLIMLFEYVQKREKSLADFGGAHALENKMC